MSIILRALKKLQEEKAREVDAPPADGVESEGSALSEEVIPSSLAIQEDEPGFGTTRNYMADVAARSRAPSPKPERTHQRFGVGPKSLLLVVLVLGIFTTGWFASRIYVNMKLATRSGESAPQNDRTAAVVSKAALSEPLQETATEAAAVTPASPRPEATPPAAASAPSSIVEVVDTEPPQRVAETPPSTTVPAPGQAKETVPKKKGRPELKINAIAWRNKEPRAIVNMQSVYEGDVIEGATVLAIQRKVILFEYDGETFEVRF